MNDANPWTYYTGSNVMSSNSSDQKWLMQQAAVCFSLIDKYSGRRL